MCSTVEQVLGQIEEILDCTSSGRLGSDAHGSCHQSRRALPPDDRRAALQALRPQVGDDVLICRGVFLDGKGGICLGDSVGLAEDVVIFTHSHSESVHSEPRNEGRHGPDLDNLWLRDGAYQLNQHPAWARSRAGAEP